MLKEIIKQVYSAFYPKKKGFVNPVEDKNFFRTLRELSLTGLSTSKYTDSVWVFASINAIAQNISRIPFVFYKEGKYQGRGYKSNDKIKIESGKLYDLFTNPNEFMHGNLLFYATIVYLELFGESFWVMDRNNTTEIPREITVVPPYKMSPVIENNNFMGKWLYKATVSKSIELMPYEVLHFKHFDPYNPIRGISPYDAARLGIEQDKLANEYNRQFFGAGVALSGIIKVNGFLSDDQYNRLRAQFTEGHSVSAGKAHQVAIIENADFIETRAMSQKDMEFSVLKKIIREEILAAYKTNEVVLGIYSNIQSYEGIRNAHEAFWKETIIPKAINIQDLLWAKFFSKINGGREWGEFDFSDIEALRSDLREKVQLAQKLNQIGYPINIINERLNLGLPRVPWGDYWWTKPDISTPSANSNQNDNNPEPVEETDEVTEKTVEDFFYDDYRDRQKILENMFFSKLKKFFFEQRKRVLSNLSSDKELLDVEDEKNKLSSLLVLLCRNCIADALFLLSKETSKEIKESSEMLSFIDERAKTSANIIINSIESMLADKDIEEIKTIYNKMDSRVKKIARTETVSIINNLRFMAMMENGIQKHMWFCNKSDRHGFLKGRIVNIGETFVRGIVLRFPGDIEAPANEVVGCLCYTIPVTS